MWSIWKNLKFFNPVRWLNWLMTGPSSREGREEDKGKDTDSRRVDGRSKIIHSTEVVAPVTHQSLNLSPPQENTPKLPDIRDPRTEVNKGLAGMLDDGKNAPDRQEQMRQRRESLRNMDPVRSEFTEQSLQAQPPTLDEYSQGYTLDPGLEGVSGPGGFSSTLTAAGLGSSPSGSGFELEEEDDDLDGPSEGSGKKDGKAASGKYGKAGGTGRTIGGR